MLIIDGLQIHENVQIFEGIEVHLVKFDKKMDQETKKFLTSIGQRSTLVNFTYQDDSISLSSNRARLTYLGTFNTFYVEFIEGEDDDQ